MAPSQTALWSPVYHFYYTHLHFHISYLHFLCRYKSDGLWLIRPLCSELASVRTPRRTGDARRGGSNGLSDAASPALRAPHSGGGKQPESVSTYVHASTTSQHVFGGSEGGGDQNTKLQELIYFCKRCRKVWDEMFCCSWNSSNG